MPRCGAVAANNTANERPAIHPGFPSGIGSDDAAYILDTFPIVREQDEKAFGRYRTKELVLAYLNAVAAGDLVSVVSI